MSCFTCALAGTLLLAAAELRAENWPNWRGPDSNGIARTSELPIRWSESENIVWNLPLSGQTGSTPIIWGDRIFLTSSRKNDFVLQCISIDGEPLWERPLAKAIGPAGPKEEAKDSAASPSTDGKHVYTLVYSGEVACHDFAGNEVWNFNSQERYGKFEILHGVHNTPLLHGDILFLVLLHANGQWVVALDKATGMEIWKIDRKTDAVAVSREAYASPCLWIDGARTNLIVTGCDYVTGHRLDDGSEIWRLGDLNPKEKYNTTMQMISTPVATPEMLLVPTTKGGVVVAVKPGARGLIEGGGPFELWRAARGSPDVPSPLVHGGLVYLARENGLLHCLDASTGEELYLRRLHADHYRASPILAAGRIYLIARDGTVSVVKAGRTFELLATNALDDTFAASPAVANGRLYLRGFRSLYAIGEGQSSNRPFTSPASDTPEYGHGLTADEARDGWIALFDGQTIFGWSDADVDAQTLSGGQTTSIFGSCELKGEALTAGQITLGDQVFPVASGRFEHSISGVKPGPVQLGSSVGIRSLRLKPAGLKAAFNGRDMTGWNVLRHPKLPDDRQTKWSVDDGALAAVGGPGAVELEGRYGDLVLQVEVRMRARLVNGGVFFRSVPGQFMNGYEAQLFNGCYGHDPSQPARYSTGAIDDRQLARRLVSRDIAPFTMTVVAAGPHIATWVNGSQMTDWTDMRSRHENPREGLRLEAGTIQLQAHDPETDIVFRRVSIAGLK